MTFVSVLLPVHNGARYLTQAIRSVLNQTHRDFELLVVDDGSSDGSGQIAQSCGDSRVRVIRSEQNVGLPAALNLGLREARAEIVARQDADDLSHPERLVRQVAFLASNSAIGLVGTQAWVIDAEGRCLGAVEHARHHAALLWELAFDNAFIHSSVAFRRDLVLTMFQGYDEAAGYNEDYDLWVKLSQKTRLANLPERLVAWRSHDASKTRTTSPAANPANERIVACSLPLVADAPSAEVVSLVVRAQQGLSVPELRRLTPLLHSWAKAYEEKVSPSERKDFRRAVSRQYLSLAFSRRDRSLSRVASSLWSGRSHARDIVSSFLSFLSEKARLRFGRDPIARFNGAV